VIIVGRRDDELGEILVQIRTCQALQCLPVAGGLNDQPWNYVVLTMMVLSADAEKAELDRKKNAADKRQH
jgi:hypothetical protein